MALSWTQCVCDDCWDRRYHDAPSPRRGEGPEETCCDCGKTTHSGIYIRVDPASVRYPREEVE